MIVHQLTALGRPGPRDMRNPDRFGAMTNRLRTEGTDHLLAAGRAVGIRRLIAQSIAIGTYAAPAVRSRPRRTRWTSICRPRALGADALRYLEDAVTGSGAEGLVLRYGPSTDGTASASIPRPC